jgi:CHASE3 domain sensor protein
MYQLLQLVVDAETGERVYLLAGERVHLEAFRIARDQYREILAAVALQVPGNPTQLASLSSLQLLLAARFDDLERSIAPFDRRLSGPTQQRMPSDGHNAVIHRIQALIDDMEREQVRLLASRDPQSHTLLWMILAAGFIINAVAIALLVLLYLMIQSSFAAQSEGLKGSERLRSFGWRAALALNGK